MCLCGIGEDGDECGYGIVVVGVFGEDGVEMVGE